MNATIQLTTEQVIDFIQQMPPKEKWAVLIALAEKASIGEEERMKYAESQVRQLCASRGLNWDTMTEEEREDFIDDLVHEDRECSQ
ncbi:MAG: hypothetical protein OYL97_08240 [Candidatus Poribacteria bacterium]|nr:hypothetical protein [Candidatus Poribacteria bacterium]